MWHSDNDGKNNNNGVINSMPRSSPAWRGGVAANSWQWRGDVTDSIACGMRSACMRQRMTYVAQQHISMAWRVVTRSVSVAANKRSSGGGVASAARGLNSGIMAA